MRACAALAASNMDQHRGPLSQIRENGSASLCMMAENPGRCTRQFLSNGGGWSARCLSRATTPRWSLGATRERMSRLDSHHHNNRIHRNRVRYEVEPCPQTEALCETPPSDVLRAPATAL